MSRARTCYINGVIPHLGPREASFARERRVTKGAHGCRNSTNSSANSNSDFAPRRCLGVHRYREGHEGREQSSNSNSDFAP